MKLNTFICTAAVLCMVSAAASAQTAPAAASAAPASSAPAASSASPAASDYSGLFNLTHQDIITQFGVPDRIYTKRDSSLKTDGSYKSKDIAFQNDISFVYKDLTIFFDDQGQAADTDYTLYKEQLGSLGFLHVCGMFFAKDMPGIPYNLSFNDTLADFITKLGNPDTYSPTMISYKVKVQNEKNMDKRSLGSKVYSPEYPVDEITIGFKDSKVSYIMIEREHRFDVNAK